jgi:aldehyde dehydrogenase (NAD+)
MEQKLNVVFKAQQAYKYTLRTTNAAERVAKLKVLKDAIEKYELRIFSALKQDLRKSKFESAVTELYFVYSELDFAIKHIANWMRPKRIGNTLSSPFTKNRIYTEPKGVCLIISPWNYPFQLTMSPLISAIAAGNCIMVKPSELSSATSAIIHKIINEAFDEHEIACFQGNAKIATALLKLPFDHIFFTGSTAVGKIVMEAAAKNLSAVTLELGGKSPTIIDSSANIVKAAEKIAWGKLVNSGQTCIAPDYVFVPQQQVDQFICLYKLAVEKMYDIGNDEVNPQLYGKIISAEHFNRLRGLIDEALEKGARLAFGGNLDKDSQTIEPMVLTHVPIGAKIMEEEIFGPVLLIVPYNELTEVIDQINAKNKALALYIFSKNKKNMRRLIKNTSAGGTCVNDVLIHISNPKLPFGGINGSGMGSSHGIYGFKSFSHERTVVFQNRIDFNKFIYPPYKGKEWVLKLLKRII